MSGENVDIERSVLTTFRDFLLTCHPEVAVGSVKLRELERAFLVGMAATLLASDTTNPMAKAVLKVLMRPPDKAEEGEKE